MKKILVLLICILTLLALASCGNKVCQHRDADDNSLCDKCGEGYTDGKDKGECQHIYNSSVTKEPTCTESGEKTYSCSKCGYSYNVELPAAHKMENGSCTKCDYTLIPTEGIIYDISADGTYAMVKGYEGDETDIVIANEYEGLPVTSIFENAFQGTYITSVIIPDGVTSIGENAFSDCTSLTSVTIGNGVISIGEDAFRECTSLTSVYITDIANWCGIAFGCEFANPVYYAENLYLNGELVTELVIPDSVASIGDFAFCGCTSLTGVTIPDGVNSIGLGAFYGCTSLTSIKVDANNTAYKDIDGNLYSKDGKTLIQYALGKTDESLTIPDGVVSIDVAAFAECTSLTSVTIPDGVTSIGYMAFYECTSLTSVTIGDSVTSIGDLAFSDCSSLTSVTIGSNVTSIGSSAFIGCSSLTSVTISDSVISIGDGAFYKCTSLTSVTIPDSVTSIGEGAFYHCTSLTSVSIGKGVTSIGEAAFLGCSSLTSIKYKGTEEQWKAVTKGFDWKIFSEDCEITYNYTE